MVGPHPFVEILDLLDVFHTFMVVSDVFHAFMVVSDVFHAFMVVSDVFHAFMVVSDVFRGCIGCSTRSWLYRMYSTTTNPAGYAPVGTIHDLFGQTHTI